MRKILAAVSVAALSLLGLAGGVATAGAAEPGQACALTYGADDVIISPGASDCIVRYATEDAALAAVAQARADGEFVWFADGVIVNDGSGFVVRADTYGVPEYFLVNFDMVALGLA